jgi:hypothetical protein
MTTQVIMDPRIELPVENPTEFRRKIINDFHERFCDLLNGIDYYRGVDIKISENLEKGIFNYSLQEASETNVTKQWNNGEFVRIYLDKFREIILSLNTMNAFSIINKDILAHRVAFETDYYFDNDFVFGEIDYNNYVDINNCNNFNHINNTNINIDLEEELYDYSTYKNKY